MKNYLILILLSMTIVLQSCKEEPQPEIELVTAEEMKELSELEDIQLVDVRTPEEYKEGYIDSAQNIDYNSPSFNTEIEKLDKSKPVIVYCQKGGRSAKCAQKMKDAGFVKIYDLDGGLAKWKYKGFEINSFN
ncbi:MAG: rhodanese-like domain-containing protein [Bacteroidia bacterium]|nr:rhodanese-like domain-containing protein [Bacteroidia bacterium]MBT8278321.1 rhodanese-like domain-containing protein [Bacteroidia bacterium]NND26127.1 rhodanese-like domain-containing protein [Flavobacteriaceae bacterium]NNK60068.1 rhodanese-like domain-containing protein [Flavobacteriaceae bacterium]NNL34118.1 rhodanese-like domain-containing protein [Flavobacteriaceae bacterium]